MTVGSATVSCLYYGRRSEVWTDEDAEPDFIACNTCERRFVGGTEATQLERYIKHKVDGVCGTPGP